MFFTTIRAILSWLRTNYLMYIPDLKVVHLISLSLSLSLPLPFCKGCFVWGECSFSSFQHLRCDAACWRHPSWRWPDHSHHSPSPVCLPADCSTPPAGTHLPWWDTGQPGLERGESVYILLHQRRFNMIKRSTNYNHVRHYKCTAIVFTIVPRGFLLSD